eukprot:COSAG02_NODE_34056_length_490_cov_0.910486_1_plen_42_part_10
MKVEPPGPLRTHQFLGLHPSLSPLYSASLSKMMCVSRVLVAQ